MHALNTISPQSLMLLTRHQACLWASRTQLCCSSQLRWRSGAALKKKIRAAARNTENGPRDRKSENLLLVRAARRFTWEDRTVTTTNTGSDQLKPSDRHIAQTRLLATLIQETTFNVLRRNVDRGVNPAWGISDRKADILADEFEKEVRRQCYLAEIEPSPPPLFAKFRQAFVTGGREEVDKAVQLAFHNFILAPQFTEREVQKHVQVSDLTFPTEWFPATRALQRKVILHVGPTNSGKTYQALKRLEQAKSGIFAGPLRLLAHEVYTRFNDKNVPCALVTGEERRMPPGYDETQEGEVLMRSCTVEMVPLQSKVDVAVIDEIQMIGDESRGWAWTQAFLGIQAKELHVCGEERTVPLIKDLCALIGDELEVNHYKRLSPLQAMNNSLRGGLRQLQKGDAVISFSRVGIHSLKTEIEKATGKRCAVVYGSLPPETRAQQAALFNDPDNEYDILVASDAVGMGLNLSIKRIIFERLWKFDGIEDRLLRTPEVKQIAGRAGRYRTAAQAITKTSPEVVTNDPGFIKPQPEKKSPGLVTCLNATDLPHIHEALNEQPAPIATAGIFPPDFVVQQFASYFPPKTPFSYVLTHLHEIAKMHPRFHLCELKDQIVVADIIQQFDLTVPERLTFCAAPIQTRQMGMISVVQSLARCVVEQSGGELVDIRAINLELLDEPENHMNKNYLVQLESLHNAINLYLWLSYRFAGVFRSASLGFHLKEVVQGKIDRFLAAGHFKRGAWVQESHQKKREKLRRSEGRGGLGEDIGILERGKGDIREEVRA